MTTERTPRMDRFWSKVDIGDCWLWLGGKAAGRYGGFYDRGKWRPAHLVAYEELVGPVPDGLELDHLCRVTHCVNPDHLEPVTHGDNVRRGRGPIHHRIQTKCKWGHLFDEANTRYEKGRLHRTCRACEREKSRARRAA